MYSAAAAVGAISAAGYYAYKYYRNPVQALPSLVEQRTNEVHRAISRLPAHQQFQPFPTILHVNNPISTFSDIHGDIHALLVCLRDCAKVIRKRKTPDLGEFHPELESDEHFNRFLEMDINHEEYQRDLGYEWRSCRRKDIQ